MQPAPVKRQAGKVYRLSKDRAKSPVVFQWNRAIIPVGNLKVGPSMKENPDVLQGTLALMVLKTLDALGPQHGYGDCPPRIEQISRDVLAVNQGTLYPLLLKLEMKARLAGGPAPGALSRPQ
jgi:hypothetical protein